MNPQPVDCGEPTYRGGSLARTAWSSMRFTPSRPAGIFLFPWDIAGIVTISPLARGPH